MNIASSFNDLIKQGPYQSVIDKKSSSSDDDDSEVNCLESFDQHNFCNTLLNTSPPSQIGKLLTLKQRVETQSYEPNHRLLTSAEDPNYLETQREDVTSDSVLMQSNTPRT